jgi:uncharacterized protein with PQ loop repeat
MILSGLVIASGYLGAALSVGMVVPQLVRTIRNPDVWGVSATSWALTGVGCLTWLLYGIRAGELPQVPGNALIVPGAAAIVLIAPARASVPLRAVILAAASAAVIVAAIYLRPADVGYLAFAVGLVAAWPQAAESVRHARSAEASAELVRHARSAEASAVSLPAWLMRGGAQVGWLGYAIGRHDVPVLVAAVVNLCAAIALVAVETRYQSRRAVSATAA